MNGSTPLHLLAGILLLEAILATGFFKYRREIAAAVAKWRQADNMLSAAEFVLLFTAAAVSNRADLWKAASWEDHSVRMPYALTAVISLSRWALAAKLFRESLKGSLKGRIDELEDGLAKERADRNRRIFQASQIRRLIDRKLSRFRDLAKREQIAVEDVLGAWNAEVQAITILKSLHEFFYQELRKLHPDAQLRLGVYLPNSEQTEMMIRYSWNGEHDDCIASHPDQMRLVSGSGPASEIVRVFHARGNIEVALVPDCGLDRSFRFWTDEQARYLRSLICVKYQLQVDGTDSALVLSLDCDRPNFFSRERAEELRTFIVEMLVRFEYELVSAELRTKLQQPLESHEQRSPLPSAGK